MHMTLSRLDTTSFTYPFSLSSKIYFPVPHIQRDNGQHKLTSVAGLRSVGYGRHMDTFLQVQSLTTDKGCSITSFVVNSSCSSLLAEYRSSSISSTTRLPSLVTHMTSPIRSLSHEYIDAL